MRLVSASCPYTWSFPCPILQNPVAARSFGPYPQEMSKLWGGRFRDTTDRAFEDFNSSLPFDRRLFTADLLVARAHAESLFEAGVLSESELKIILEGLQSVENDGDAIISAGLQNRVEDVHTLVENALTERVGDVGFKLNTGRSRNDQIVTDLRLYLRDAVDAVQSLVKELQSALLDLGERHPEVPIPGYTHLQRAQPILLAHYLLAYFEMLQRDRSRLADARCRVDVSPLGSAALAGASYKIDRRLQAERLGFSSISRNSLDAVSDRDFVLEVSSAFTLLMMHLSRLCEDLILYSTDEFGFFSLSDTVTTGSSLLPQKKNPDSLELIRGKCARVYGHHVTLLSLLKAQPLAYNKDLQEDKEPIFDSLDSVRASLSVMRSVVESLEVRSGRLTKASRGPYMNALEVADYLVAKGLPFRQAHQIAGRAVRAAIALDRPLEEMSLSDFRNLCDLFEQDVFEALGLESSLSTKSVSGGTAPERVVEALAQARGLLIEG